MSENHPDRRRRQWVFVVLERGSRELLLVAATRQAADAHAAEIIRETTVSECIVEQKWVRTAMDLTGRSQ